MPLVTQSNLLSIINASPTLDTISQLTDAFIELSRQNPEKTDDYASALTSAKNSWKVPETNVGDSSAPQDKSFEGILLRYFYNALTAMLHESSTTYIQPSNSYIVASFVSGTAIRISKRYLFLFSTNRTYFSGFTLLWVGHWGPERSEINAVGECVHLIAAGKEVYNGSLIEEAELKKRLRKIESCIKDPAGLRILEVSLKEIVLICAHLIEPSSRNRKWRTVLASLYLLPTSGRQFFRDRTCINETLKCTECVQYAVSVRAGGCSPKICLKFWSLMFRFIDDGYFCELSNVHVSWPNIHSQIQQHTLG